QRLLNAPDDLLSVRTLPNGRVDLLSINESVRVQINTAFQMQNTDFAAFLKQDTERLSDDESPS
ncbi:hypothetical protein, partial [Pseudomonas savastanoi]